MSGVGWQYFSEAAYTAGDKLGQGEDKYARNKFNQVSFSDDDNSNSANDDYDNNDICPGGQ